MKGTILAVEDPEDTKQKRLQDWVDRALSLQKKLSFLLAFFISKKPAVDAGFFVLRRPAGICDKLSKAVEIEILYLD